MTVRKKYGFSLVELSIVLVIIGVLVAITLSLGNGQMSITNITSTRNKMDRVEDALLLYYKLNSALPCPASRTAALSSTLFGIGLATATTTNTVANDVSCGNATTVAGMANLFVGALPTRDLGLSDDYMFDSWGNRVTYLVSKYCVDPDDWNGASSSKCTVDGTALGATGANIPVKDGNGTTRPTPAVYALISYGRDGYGGFSRSGVQTAPGSAPAKESVNANIQTAGTGAVTDAFINDGTNAPTYFDDVVRWKPGNIFQADAIASTSCSESSPVIKGYATNNYYYPCADKGSQTIYGNNNMSFGSGAGAALTGVNGDVQQGSNNFFAGYQAGKATTTGYNNIFFGYVTGTANTTGSDNLFLGTQAGSSNTTGTNNIYLGAYTGLFNTTGSSNIAVGGGAGYSLAGGSSNVMLGGGAGYYVTTGTGHTFVGSSAGFNVTNSSSVSTFIGNAAGQYSDGISNTYLGNQAGNAGYYYGGVFDGTKRQGAGQENVYVGENAGLFAGNGSQNVYMGNLAGEYGGGSRNTLVGYQAGWQFANGMDNTALGYRAGGKFIGNGPKTGGSSNTFIGSSAGLYHQDGTNNTYVGYYSGSSELSGTFNTYIGDRAGVFEQYGSYNTYIGTSSGVAYGSGSATNSTALGNGALIDANNQVVLGNYAVTSTVINGVLKINTATSYRATSTTAGSRIVDLVLAQTPAVTAWAAATHDAPAGFITINVGGTNYRMPYYRCVGATTTC